MILHVLIAMVAGWINRHQQQVIAYLQEENRVLKAHHGGRRAASYRHRTPPSRRTRSSARSQRLKEIATLVTPDTLLRWYKRLIARKFDGSTQRTTLGTPRVAEEVEQLVVQWPKRTRPGVIAASRVLSRIWGITSTNLPCATSCVATIWSPPRNDGKRA